MQHPNHAQFDTYAPCATVQSPYAATAGDLVEHYKPLVRKLAWQVHGRASRTSQLDDLVQVGFMALIEARNTYVDQGYSFTTYASLRIRGSMIDHMRREMTVGRAAYANNRRLEAARQSLTQTLGRSPSPTELAAQMGIATDDIFAIEQKARMGELTAIEDCAEHIQSLSDPDQADPEQCAEQAQLLDTLRDSIDRLDQREQMVLQLYFVEELNLHEIGQTLNVSAARICQIKTAALAKLKGLMETGSDG